ncbi:MAG: FAD-binding protein [Candidatus Korobacteraceae bacterium]|jgi:succinate dehydrogenase/fumarate reductase flavoprotein subunit
MIAIDKKSVECDVLVVGGGIGGLMAAIGAADGGAKVVVAEKANTKRSGSGATGNDHFQCYIPEIHGSDIAPIMKEMNECLTGGWLDQDMTRLFLMESFDRVKDWDRWGIPMRPHGSWEFNGHAKPGRPRIFLKYGGAPQKEVLTREALKRGVTIMNKVPISDVITNKEGVVIGAIGVSIAEDAPEMKIFRTKNVIMTTGNTSRLYPPRTAGWMFNTANCPACTGGGRAAAYRAGAKLVNIEMPNTHAGPKYFARCGKATWIGVLRDLDGKPVGPFVTQPTKELGDVTADVWHGVFGYKNKAGQSVYMDCSGIAEEDLSYMRWGLEQEGDTSLLEAMANQGIDLRKHMVEFQQYEPILIGRGVQINQKAETEVPGLYAAGDEVGNFRADIAGACIYGHIAGRNAAARAATISGFENAEESPLVEKKRELYSQILERKSGPSWKEATVAVQNLMNDYAGIEVRSEVLFKTGLEYLARLQESALGGLTASNSHELMRCQEALDLIEVGELIMHAGDFRKETRGKHIRVDHPYTNPLLDNKFVTVHQVNSKPVAEWRDRT